LLGLPAILYTKPSSTVGEKPALFNAARPVP